MSIRVVIADDHGVVRQGVRMALALDPEMDVVGEATNGAEAVDLARRLRPDVVVMDLIMPKVDGIAATAAIRAELPDTEVVALTSVLDDESVVRAVRAGAIGYLLKDTGTEEICRAVRRAAEKQVALSPAAAARLMRELQAPSVPQALTSRETEVLRLVGPRRVCMRWSDEGRSSDLEDRRGETPGGFGLPHIGIGGAILLLVLSLVFHRNFFALLSGGSSSGGSTQSHPVEDSTEEPEVHFVSFVLDDAQRTWTQIFQQQGRSYRHAKLVLFRDAVDSACGTSQSATGPFYCPDDEKVYIDLSFYDELKQRFGAPGDFAQAYVLAHEIGHHMQKLLGIETQVQRAMATHPGERNALSVRLELQADCLAGVWGHSTEQRNILEAGDVDEALRAASAVGDDRLQRMATGRVNPDSFTHGTSEQRAHWFDQGFQSGNIAACDTFSR